MIQDLEYLIKLQDIDLRIKEQELAKERYPAMAADLEAQIKNARAEHGATADKLEQLETSIASIEAEIGRMRENLVRSQERLNSIQTNREYDAVHKEIEAQKGMLAATEERQKNLAENIQNLRTALEETAAAADKAATELRPQIDDLNAKIGAIDSNIAEISKERDEVSPHISVQILRTYDSIRKKRKNGKAVSMVNDSKTCSACYMVLQPQMFNEVRKGSKVILCESCGSILLYNE